MLSRPLLLLSALAFAEACASTPPRFSGGARPPQSIMVAPPVDESGSAEAVRYVAPALTRPLVEHGYYVFPSSVVSPVLSRLKIDAADPEAIGRLDGVFGAEAILLTRIKAYKGEGEARQIAVLLTLRDVKSGRVLWEGEGTAERIGVTDEPAMRRLAEAANAGAMRNLPRGR